MPLSSYRTTHALFAAPRRPAGSGAGPAARADGVGPAAGPGGRAGSGGARGGVPPEAPCGRVAGGQAVQPAGVARETSAISFSWAAFRRFTSGLTTLRSYVSRPLSSPSTSEICV